MHFGVLCRKYVHFLKMWSKPQEYVNSSFLCSIEYSPTAGTVYGDLDLIRGLFSNLALKYLFGFCLPIIFLLIVKIFFFCSIF